MNMQKFLAAYNETRNGANKMIRHSLVRDMIFSDGVRDCVTAGLWWMLDVVATEGVDHMRRQEPYGLMIVTFKVDNNSVATLTGRLQDDDPKPWVRKVSWTDCEPGEWKFLLQHDGEHYACALTSEY
jgi:hypothetical protein